MVEHQRHSHRGEVVIRPLVPLVCRDDVLATCLHAAALSCRPAVNEFPFLLHTDGHICIGSHWHEQQSSEKQKQLFEALEQPQRPELFVLKLRPGRYCNHLMSRAFVSPCNLCFLLACSPTESQAICCNLQLASCNCNLASYKGEVCQLQSPCKAFRKVGTYSWSISMARRTSRSFPMHSDDQLRV